MFLIQANSKVGMKWATVEEEKGVNILLKYVVLYSDFTYKYTHCSQ